MAADDPVARVRKLLYRRLRVRRASRRCKAMAVYSIVIAGDVGAAACMEDRVDASQTAPEVVRLHARYATKGFITAEFRRRDKPDVAAFGVIGIRHR
eukprot:71809-Chlamydomonas_euryale.AAC.2